MGEVTSAAGIGAESAISMSAGRAVPFARGVGVEVDSSRICCSGLGEGSDILRTVGVGTRFGGRDALVWVCFALWSSAEGTRIVGVWSLGSFRGA